MNLASTHQKHKTDVAKFEEQVRELESDLSGARRQAKRAEQEVIQREEAFSRSQTDLQCAREETTLKGAEVGHADSGTIVPL